MNKVAGLEVNVEGLDELRLELGLDTGQVTGATHYHQFQEVLGLGERLQEGKSDETHVLNGLIFL